MGAVAFGITSCKRSNTQTPVTNPEPIRLTGVLEPAELLIPPQKKIEVTAEMGAMVDATKNIKGGSELSQLPAVDSFISKYPEIGDMYPIRVELRCMKGDLPGARVDIGEALSHKKWIVSDDPKHDETELIAIRAKLSYIARNDAATLDDIQRLIDSYSSDINYLTDGRVKPADQPNSVCAWGPQDVDVLIQRTHRDPRALLFRGIYYAAFSPLDDASKPLAERDLAEAVKADPHNADPYFYSAVGAKKITAFKALGFSAAETSELDRHLIGLYSGAIGLNSHIGEAYAERADAYLTEHNSRLAIPDYDKAILMDPKNARLWNDRGLAKGDTYDKSGAIEDLSHALELKSAKGDTDALLSSVENRGDLYMKLGNYKKALADYTTLIVERLRGALLFMNLDFFRELYPEYAGIDDSHLREKLHRMYYPNFSDDDFKKTMDNPQGMHPSTDGELPEAYLKRADALLAMVDFRAAKADYARSQRFQDQHAEITRWRQSAGLPKMELDIQTVDTTNLANETVWIRTSRDDDSLNSLGPTEF